MRAAFFFLCSLLWIPATYAHTDGLSFEREVGNVLIDIGFGKDMPVVGSTLTYSFDLFDVADSNAYAFEPFSKVHVRIFNGRTELLNRTLDNDGVDVPFLSFNYKEAGDYSMSVVYERKGKEPIDATFGYRVTEPAPATVSHGKVGQVTGILGSVVALLAIGYAIIASRRSGNV